MSKKKIIFPSELVDSIEVPKLKVGTNYEAEITKDAVEQWNAATKVEASTNNGNIQIDGVDTVVYTHPTLSGNKHIPSGGSSGQILRWSADGTAAWGADNNYTLGSFEVTATADELNVLDGITATTAELNYVDGVTSNIQTQLDSKAASSAVPELYLGTEKLKKVTYSFVNGELNITFE